MCVGGIEHLDAHDTYDYAFFSLLLSHLPLPEIIRLCTSIKERRIFRVTHAIDLVINR